MRLSQLGVILRLKSTIVFPVSDEGDSSGSHQAVLLSFSVEVLAYMGERFWTVRLPQSVTENA
ncbi:hypothetical protein E2C01_091963 [Portunus trituberculatus]|uniref:Uncharacterized protein n=1 Tax=Portunus trituberculatus TaxID=210409 RepID=A0A5B7JUB5_PORTR|nr:hypothetical protein [Portunus trituberculatus]